MVGGYNKVGNPMLFLEAAGCLVTPRYKRLSDFAHWFKLILLHVPWHLALMSLHHNCLMRNHYDVIKWKYFSRYWPFAREIHRSPVNSTHKGQRRGALMFPLISAWTNTWANNGDAGDLTSHRANYDVTVTFERYGASWYDFVDVFGYGLEIHITW